MSDQDLERRKLGLEVAKLEREIDMIDDQRLSMRAAVEHMIAERERWAEERKEREKRDEAQRMRDEAQRKRDEAQFNKWKEDRKRDEAQFKKWEEDRKREDKRFLVYLMIGSAALLGAGAALGRIFLPS